MIEKKSTKWKKVSSEQKAKIIEEKINNPDLSAKEIAERAWTSERTASRTIKEKMAKVGDQSVTIANLIDRNKNLQSVADDLILELIASRDDKITIAQLTSLRESTFKQNQLLENKPTENIKQTDEVEIKDLQDMDSAKLAELRKALID